MTIIYFTCVGNMRRIDNRIYVDVLCTYLVSNGYADDVDLFINDSGMKCYAKSRH